MIKKMRQRVVLASMLAFFAVIALIGISVNVVNYCITTRNADNTLTAILKTELNREEAFMSENPGEMPPMQPFMGLPNLELNYMTRFFVIRLDKYGNVSWMGMDYIAAVTSFDAMKYGAKIIEKNANHGYIDDFRFIKSESKDSTIIVFLNVSKEKQSMKSLLLLTLIVSAVSLAIVFVLVELFAGRAIRPIANNIKM